MSMKRAFAVALVGSVASIATGACSSDSNAASTSAGATPVVEIGRPFPADRCAENRAAGTIRYLSGFDFAAAASIVDVLTAKQKGYFDDVCLDVEVEPSLAITNYERVDSGSAQFASGGSFSELAMYAVAHPDHHLSTLAVEGRTAIDALIVKAGPGQPTTLAGLRGATIGVKGGVTVSVQAMLAAAGLVAGTDYQIAPMEGFDPAEHIALPNIVGFTAYKSNEPGQLERAGIPFTLFDPSAQEIPGSFGTIFANTTFVQDHPTAAVDFMRASMKGLADAIADTSAASMIALDFIDNNGNPQGLSTDGEAFRWQTESELVTATTPAGEPVGLPDPDELRDEVEAYADIGLFGGNAPDVDTMIDTTIVRSVYNSSNVVIWPLG
jgi:ABC-type nitrate/sulfonate/bicarbonate transport system substrate-binding protein